MRTHKSKRILPTSSSACSVLKRTLQPTAGPSRGCHGDSDEARRPHGTWRHGEGLTFDPEPHGAVRPIDAAWKELSSQSQKKPGHWRIRRQREERKQWGKRKDRTGNASWEKNSKVGKDSRIERERERDVLSASDRFHTLYCITVKSHLCFELKQELDVFLKVSRDSDLQRNTGGVREL